jgi:hypothetical protein
MFASLAATATLQRVSDAQFLDPSIYIPGSSTTKIGVDHPSLSFKIVDSVALLMDAFSRLKLHDSMRERMRGLRHVKTRQPKTMLLAHARHGWGPRVSHNFVLS